MPRTRDLDYYQRLLETVQMLPQNRGTINTARARVQANAGPYHEAEALTGVPWRLIGALHYRECGCLMSRGLHNGQRWDRVTTQVPKGRGPFSTWTDAALDALVQARMAGHADGHWTMPRMLRAAEQYNGWGYAFRDKPSPYIWNWTNHGVGAGYYTADGQYSETAKNRQAGVVSLLMELGI